MKNKTRNEMTRLQNKYESVCNEYVQKFCKKQGMEFNYWVSDIVGDVLSCSDFYFNFQDIVWDVNSKQPKGSITDWYYQNLDAPEKSINYYSYTKGLRVSEIK